MDHHRQIASLPLDLINLIADRLLADDVVEYIRFRTVCREWRLLTASPCTFASQFRPRHWIMHRYLPSAPCRFHNPFTGRSLTFHLPELESYFIISACDGLLVLIEEKMYIMRLYNPFTRRMSDGLPPLLLEFGFSYDLLHKYKQWPHLEYTILADDSQCPTLLFYILHEYHYFAKPGDAKWKCIINDVDAVSTCKGRFYYVSPTHGIGLMEPEKMLVTPLNIPVQYAVNPIPIFFNLGSDLLFRRRTSLFAHTFEIFKVDLESNTLVKFDGDLEDYALSIPYYGQPVMVPSRNHNYKQLRSMFQGLWCNYVFTC